MNIFANPPAPPEAESLEAAKLRRAAELRERLHAIDDELAEIAELAARPGRLYRERNRVLEELAVLKGVVK